MTPLEKSLLPNNSLRDILSQLLQEVKSTDTSNPRTFTDLIERIKNLVQNLQSEQIQHKAVHDKMSRQCDDEISFRCKETDMAKEALNKTLEAKEKCVRSLNETNFLKENLTEMKRRSEAALESAKSQREEENKLYKKKKTELDQDIAEVDDFSNYLNNGIFASADEFRNKTKKFNVIKQSSSLYTNMISLSSTLKMRTHSSNSTAASSYQPDSKTLSELKSNATNLLQSLISSSNSLDKSEQTNLTSYTQLSATLSQNLNTLQTQFDNLTQQSESMIICVTDEEAIQAKASAKLLRNDRLKTSAIEMCEKFDKEFTDATHDRLEEIQTIEEILKIMQERFKKRPVDLEKYLDSVKTGLVDYINSTEFKEFEDYKHKKVEDSQHGKELAKENDE